MTTTLEIAEQLADELYGLHCDIGRLEVENARLRKQVEQLHADQAYWELGNCPHCPNVVSLQEAFEQNARLQELVDYMTPIALYVASEQERNHMRELGVEVGE